MSLMLTRAIDTFPSVQLPSYSGGLPVEVALISQLGHGAGDHVIANASARQRRHPAFVDALDEPSARLGAMDLAHGDASSLYSFTVGACGHPFHRHAGHRSFTAISGSGGAQLRFCTVSDAQLAQSPQAFVAALQFVNIPPDCLFTVRFGGNTWHQFVPLAGRGGHPALFALSCHTNELGGELPDAVRARVLANAADIPSLTELLPEPVSQLLRTLDVSRVSTVALSLDASAASALAGCCAVARATLGRVRAAWARCWRPRGYVADNGSGRRVLREHAAAADSLLQRHLHTRNHDDSVSLVLDAVEVPAGNASQLLAALLDGFLENRPLGVSRLMAVRNTLVRPLRLRTSPLGCPVSSLLAERSPQWFAGRFPVLEQRCEARRAEVILGADDRHLAFRSCVSVECLDDGRVRCTLATRVRTSNVFGRAYLAAIDRVHRAYIAPALLRLAVDHAVRTLRTQPAHGQRLALLAG